eukprot:jgi/Mesvir1/7850/Mv11785-RA.1
MKYAEDSKQHYESERDHLSKEIAALNHQLALAERQLASDPSRIGGSYTDSCALPHNLQAALNRAYVAVNLLSRKVIATLWVTLDVRVKVEEILSGFLSFKPSASWPSQGKKKFSRLAFVGLLSRIAFSCFEAESFNSRGSSCVAANRKERAGVFQRKYCMLEDNASGQAFEEDTLFTSWCTDFINRRLWDALRLCPGHFSGALRAHQKFLDAATRSVWRLHVLALAFEVPPELIWREQGDVADAACTECDEDTADAECFNEDNLGQQNSQARQVAFTIFPGLRLGHAHELSKCKLVLSRHRGAGRQPFLATEIRLADIIYADDTTLFEDTEHVQTWLYCLAIEACVVGLEVSKKTEALAIGLT